MPTTKTPRESAIEKYLVERVEALGGEVRKLKWIGRRGAPDRFVMLGNKSVFVEVKRPGKKPTDQQMREINRLCSGSAPATWVDSKAAVDRLLEGWICR